MPIDVLVLSAAFLTGLLGGVHCTAMCGGIAAVLNPQARQSALPHALALNLGRIGSYSLAGLLAGSLGSVFVGVFRLPDLALGLRSMMGVVLMLIALRLLFPKQFAFKVPGSSILWRVIEKAKSLLPATGMRRTIGLGAIWGWLPCGLSTSVLLAAWFEASPLHSMLLMLAFGIGTLPLMTAISYSGSRFGLMLAQRGWRMLLASLIFLAGAGTAMAPWLIHSTGAHAWLEALGCRSLL
jgi:sulfite exporter TauE/SafE